MFICKTKIWSSIILERYWRQPVLLAHAPRTSYCLEYFTQQQESVTAHVRSVFIPQSNPLKRELWKLSLHTNSPKRCQQSIHSPLSLFVIIYMHMEGWETKQWTFVVGAGFDALMNGSLVPEMQFVNVTCNLWLTHWGDTMRRGLWKDRRAKNPDKAAPLSCQQGVFELSPGKEREGWGGGILGGTAQSKQYLPKNNNSNKNTP